MPHPTTSMKLTTRCGLVAVDGLNEALLAKAAGATVLRTARVRADTTVVPANVAYPTDSGLLAKAVRRIAAVGQRIQAAGGAVRTRMRDRSRSAGKRAHGIAAKLRSRAQQGSDEVKQGVQRITGELAGLAGDRVRDAHRLLANAQRALRRAKAKAVRLAGAGMSDAAAGRRLGRLARAVGDLSGLLDATERIIAQTRQRIAGVMPRGASRVVSLHDDGVVLDHDVQQGNPADAPQLAPAIGRVKRRTGRAPRTVTADRGYGEASVDKALFDLGSATW